MDIHGELVAYYKRFYGAQNLKLVLLGEETLDAQEANLKQLFGNVKRAPENAPSYRDAGFPFTGALQ